MSFSSDTCASIPLLRTVIVKKCFTKCPQKLKYHLAVPKTAIIHSSAYIPVHPSRKFSASTIETCFPMPS